jgi:glucose/mannose-6-phosphate isomerase
MQKVDYSVDESNLRQVILDSPKQFKWVIENWKPLKLNRTYSNVIICGIGGSAWPMDFIKNYLYINPNLQLKKIPIIIHRNYNLSPAANKDSLIIISSFSGNTEEPLMSYEKILKAGLNGIAISSGGKLEKMARENGTLFIKIPDNKIQPRFATGYIVSILLKLLSDAGIIKDIEKEILRTSQFLEKMLADGKMEKEGYELAKKLNNKIPVIYSSTNYKIAGKVWKIKINENAKMPAFWSHIPEFNHNEMVGFTRAGAGKFSVLILRDKEDDNIILKVMDISANLLRKHKIPVEFVETKGEGFLNKIFYLALLCDWTSYYLAVLGGIDPTPVEMVSEFKKELENKI